MGLNLENILAKTKKKTFNDTINQRHRQYELSMAMHIFSKFQNLVF